MAKSNLMDKFELLIRVQCYLRDTETIRHNPKAYGYDLTQFFAEDNNFSNGGFFDRWEAEQFVTNEIALVRKAIMDS